MPRVPRPADLPPVGVEPPRSIAQINEGVASRIGAAGRAMGDAVSSVGAAFGEIANRSAVANDATAEGRAKLDWYKFDNEAWQGLESTAKEDGTGWENAGAIYDKGRQDILSKYQMSNPQKAEALSLWMEQQVAARGFAAGRQKTAAQSRYFTGIEDKELAGAAARVEANPNQETVDALRPALDALVEGGRGVYHNDAAIQSRKREIEAALTMAQYRGLMKTDPEAAMELRKQILGGQYQIDQGTKPGPGASGPSLTPDLTAYAPRAGGDRMEGGYASSVPGPDGQSVVRTLADVASGKSDYVTIAGNPRDYGKTFTIPKIAFVDAKGETRELSNVRAVVHDTGGAFKTAPDGRFDVAIDRDASDAQMAQSHTMWKQSGVQFVPQGGGAGQRQGDVGGRLFPIGGSQEGRSMADVPSAGKMPNSRGFGYNVRTTGHHAGLDIPGKIGDPVLAVEDGVVVRIGNDGKGYGPFVDVKYADGTIHRMAHLGDVDKGGQTQPFVPGLKEGARVTRGQTIGFVGVGGNAGHDFPHVHYEVFKDEQGYAEGGSKPSVRGLENRVDPRAWFGQGGQGQQQAPVPVAQRGMTAGMTPPARQAADVVSGLGEIAAKSPERRVVDLFKPAELATLQKAFPPLAEVLGSKDGAELTIGDAAKLIAGSDPISRIRAAASEKPDAVLTDVFTTEQLVDFSKAFPGIGKIADLETATLGSAVEAFDAFDTETNAKIAAENDRQRIGGLLVPGQVFSVKTKTGTAAFKSESLNTLDRRALQEMSGLTVEAQRVREREHAALADEMMRRQLANLETTGKDHAKYNEKALTEALAKTPKTLQTFKHKAEIAKMVYKVMDNAANLPLDVINERLSGLEKAVLDAAGDVDPDAQKAIERAGKRVAALTTLREKDPFLAVRGSTEVTAAMASIPGGTPKTKADQFKIADAAMNAQARLEIPEAIRSPISRADARVIVADILNAPETKKHQAAKATATKIHETFGNTLGPLVMKAATRLATGETSEDRYYLDSAMGRAVKDASVPAIDKAIEPAKPGTSGARGWFDWLKRTDGQGHSADWIGDLPAKPEKPPMPTRDRLNYFDQLDAKR